LAIVSTFVLIFDLGIIRQTLPFRSRKKTAEAMVMAGGSGNSEEEEPNRPAIANQTSLNIRRFADVVERLAVQDPTYQLMPREEAHTMW
jgi:hypothetical protein